MSYDYSENILVQTFVGTGIEMGSTRWVPRKMVSHLSAEN